MKVLSIKQPFANLIKEGTKKYEIRSWKTTYRGELYIHSSLSKYEKNRSNEMLKLVKDKELLYGYILFKCNLVDCVYIDKEFLNKMNEGAPSNLYRDDCLGYYAWIIESVEEIEPIKAKGQLGIWNYYFGK